MNRFFLLSRIRRNNDKYEWNKRSDLNRECQEEDCVFEEFWEHAENKKDQYGDDKNNAQKAFDALYTKECGRKGNTAERINARRQCVHNLNKSLLDNKDRWVSCVCDNGNKPPGYKCTSDVPKSCKSCNKGYRFGTKLIFEFYGGIEFLECSESVRTRK